MGSIIIILRLLTLSCLLALAAAQNGYEYNKPGISFGTEEGRNLPSSSQNSSGTSRVLSNSVGPFSGIKQGDQHSNTGYTSAPSGYPEQNQGSSFTGPNIVNSQAIPSIRDQGVNSLLSPSQFNQKVEENDQGFPGPSNIPNYSGQGYNYFGTDSSKKEPSYSGQNNYPEQNGPKSQKPQQTDEFGARGSEFDSTNTGTYEGGDYSAIPGEPDKDYPILTEIPKTSFRCEAQSYPGYYADVETRCQVFHICANNRTYDFLCPNGTIFSQQVFVCVWWNQFDCNLAPGLYELNLNIYNNSRTGFQQQRNNASNNFPLGPYPGASGVDNGFSGNTQGSFSSDTGTQNNYLSSGPETPLGYSQSSATQRPDNYKPAIALTSNQGSQGVPYYPSSTGTQNQSNYIGGSDDGTSNIGNLYSSNYQGSNELQKSPLGIPSFAGYPSGKPVGPSFPVGADGSSPQSRGSIQKPNREYLPPN